ncbi:SRPBCC family protein [Streptomyces sp. TRM64462]|uniref:SRPBCC family protein n=1 Tax=Streptomyces sp. TRM64462 TaxID=2741726 RepID=UPI0015863737|nr:SRPBCC family protein [Streptomyces sp. TRM64462]
MTEYERSRVMPALPERVFDEAADVGRLGEWLPGDLHVRAHPGELPEVTVHEDRTDDDVDALLRTRKDRLRLEWGTKDQDSYGGWLQVTGVDGGASEVTVHLTFRDPSHDPGEHTVQEALDRSLHRLEEQVRLRVEGPAG